MCFLGNMWAAGCAQPMGHARGGVCWVQNAAPSAAAAQPQPQHSADLLDLDGLSVGSPKQGGQQPASNGNSHAAALDLLGGDNSNTRSEPQFQGASNMTSSLMSYCTLHSGALYFIVRMRVVSAVHGSCGCLCSVSQDYADDHLQFCLSACLSVPVACNRGGSLWQRQQLLWGHSLWAAGLTAQCRHASAPVSLFRLHPHALPAGDHAIHNIMAATIIYNDSACGAAHT